ncbi:MAG: hypothetical protein JWQ66_3872 [Mucilaginibacter sp.]|nr:hypothetical protein [Mucilaginibacter sp.]
MATQFITNNKGEKTAVIIPITEYEDLLHQHHLNLELTDEYKAMIDIMIGQEENGKAKYVPFNDIKNRFLQSC